MKKGLLAIIGFVLLCNAAYACGGLNVPAYSGEIRYKFGNPTQEGKEAGNPLTCHITTTLYFDVYDGLENDSIMINWGDGHYTIVFATSITEDTLKPVGFSGLKPLFQHVYNGTHTYDSVPAGGFCRISIMEQYRLNYTSNIGNGLTANVPFYIEALALMDTSEGFTNEAPVMEAPNIRYGSATNTFYLDPAAQLPDPDGDSLVFEAVPPLQSNGVTVPEYLYPNQFCNKYNPGTSTFSINPETGEINWAAPCYQGIFSITTLVKKYRNGQLMGSIIRDQNVYVGSRVLTGLEEEPNENSLQLLGNPVENTLIGRFTKLDYTSTTAQIMDMSGRLLLQYILGNTSTFNIPVNHLAAGVYLLHINDAGKSYTRKFIKL